MDRDQKLQQMSYKNNVKIVRNKNRKAMMINDITKPDIKQPDQKLFETLGD